MPDPLPDYIHELLLQWDNLAFFAYDGYLREGRGVAGISGPGPDAKAFFAPRSFFEKHGPENVLGMIDVYDPETEFIVHYDDTGRTRSTRVRTPAEGKSPQQIWAIRILEALSENPDAMPQHAPGWFLDLLERLMREHEESNQRDGLAG